MKKFPFQFAINSTSLVSVLLFVYWTSEGGLRKEITQLFGKGITDGSTSNVIEHVGDILFYYAVLISTLILLTALLTVIGNKFVNRLLTFLPSVTESLRLMLELIQQLIVFAGIYAFLLHDDGRGLKNNQLILLPFWFLTSICLYVLGRVLSALIPRKLIFINAAFYLQSITIGVMLAQSFGYAPFKLI